MYNSIRTRLTAAFIGLAIGPFVLVGVVLAWQSFTTQHQQALNLQHEVAQRVATQVTAFFEELGNELHVVSQVEGLPRLERVQVWPSFVPLSFGLPYLPALHPTRLLTGSEKQRKSQNLSFQFLELYVFDSEHCHGGLAYV